MKHVFAGSLLVLACVGCKSDPAAGPLKAWDGLRAAVAAEDGLAVLKLVTAATREQKIAFTVDIRKAAQSLPPELRSKEAASWSVEENAGKLLLTELRFIWKVPGSGSPVLESASADAAVIAVIAPECTVRWAMARENGEWKFDLAGSRVVPRAPGDGNPTAAGCSERLSQLRAASFLYESKFREYPAGWEDLKRTGLITDEKLTKCPCGTGPTFEHCRHPLTDASAPETFVAWDATPHADGTRNVLLFIGRVEVLKEDVFQQRLKSQLHK